jgi:hypothetical protein
MDRPKGSLSDEARILELRTGLARRGDAEQSHVPHPSPDHQGFFLLPFKPAGLLRVVLGLQVHSKVKSQLEQMLKLREFEHVSKEEIYIAPDTRELKSRSSNWRPLLEKAPLIVPTLSPRLRADSPRRMGGNVATTAPIVLSATTLILSPDGGICC